MKSFSNPQLEVLITVKAYPNPSRSVIESSCTAGITSDGQWIRLFPLNWRSLGKAERFEKYDIITLATSPSRDSRPESHVPNLDSIRRLHHIGTSRQWDERKRWLLPHRADSVEALIESNRLSRTSLGLVRPKQIDAFLIEPADNEWRSEQEAVLSQLQLFNANDLPPLEKVPFKFSYRFKCEDNRCKTGHKMMTVDWEVYEAWRKFSKLYPRDWETKLRERFEAMMLTKETHFFLGTMFRHPRTWIIIGNFYPPLSVQQTLMAI